MLPNLLLAGAPKCGTTAAYDWLLEHPEISGGVDKELFYLMDPEDWKFNAKRNWRDHGGVGYESLFAESAAKWVMDGTTLTIYQKAALEYAEANKPRVVFFLREPAGRVYSTFKYLKNNRSVLSSKTTFSDYLAALDSGDCFGGVTQLSAGVEQSTYVNYLRRWEAAVGRENLRVIVFEDFMSNPSRGMDELCNWLGIDPGFYEGFVFRKQNESLKIKSRLLNRVKEALAKRVSSRKFKSFLRPMYFWLNSRPAQKYEYEVDEATLNSLKTRFCTSNAELADEFSLDLSGWGKR